MYAIGPDCKWPELYDCCKIQGSLLFDSFLGNSTKGYIGSVDMVVDKNAEQYKGVLKDWGI